ncbi:MAG: hypothetical protein EZS28_018677 [Streblomastix strix]|uniref:Uncharacterized protein n=1 Tax=Streblomastix strix TaxID=222440 RepID=A0A5J4VT80_9EUKA|nr:MAG: hypothetical protein EZS28_018677 [Streblomastix strix]
MLRDSDFCVISDRTVLMYNLLPNVKHMHFFHQFRNFVEELEKYPFDVKIFNGLVFEDMYKIANEKKEYFKNIQNEKNQLMFNIIISGVIPTNDNLQFVLLSNIGQGSLFGGIDGMNSKIFLRVNKDIHKPSDELAAFATLTLDMMFEPQEKIRNNQKTTSDSSSSMNQKVYKNELDLSQITKSFKTQKWNKKIEKSSIKMMNNWVHNSILMASCSSTSFNILQCMPTVRPFVIISRGGLCKCAIPARYDQTPYRDLGLRTFSSAASMMNFGNCWINPQSQLFPDYDKYEYDSFRKYVQMEIEEEITETGTLAVIPPYPVMRYHMPVFPLRFGRYKDAEVMYGISSYPILAENTRWRTLEPWQIRKVVTMMGVESDVRQRWKLSERERIRIKLKLQVQNDGKQNKQQNFGGHTELTVNQPSIVFLQEQTSPQFQKKSDVLLRLTNDTLQHPIPLNSIQRAVLQKRIMALPKEFY